MKNFKNFSKMTEAKTFFLDDEDKTLKWCNKYVDDFDVNDEIYQNRVYDYCYKYRQTVKQETIEIYRGVKLDNINDLVLNPVGTYWSFEKSGVGEYGSGSGVWKNPKKDSKLFVLTGIIKTKDIDWKHGLTSFIYYGDNQWECSLKNGTNVLITHIDDNELDIPLQAKA